MEIRNVGGVTPPSNSQNSKKTYVQNTQSPQSDDSLNVSNEARLLEDEAFIRDVLNRTPDINLERIQQVKENLQNGTYDKKEVLDTMTENLMKALGL
ncbi:MAG: flagellar biosynthesis anti-sigma factor FlgM [Brevinema sp.]